MTRNPASYVSSLTVDMRRMCESRKKFEVLNFYSMVHFFFSGQFIATSHDQKHQMVVKSKGNGTPYLEGTSSLVKYYSNLARHFFWYPTKLVFFVKVSKVGIY